MACGRLLEHAAAYYPSWDAAYAGRLGKVLGLQPARRFGTLSKGEVRCIQLVLALGHRPPLLLLDEPLDGLDPVMRRCTLTLLAEHLADTPTTLVISTHHVHEIESFTEHVGVLQRGRIVAQLSRDALMRTVRQYRFTPPENWEVPPALNVVKASSIGREQRWTVIGEVYEVRTRLMQAGADLHDVSTLSIEEAALAFLPLEAS